MNSDNLLNTDGHKYFGKLIFEIKGKSQKKGLFRRTKSHLAFYESGIAVEELGNRTEILKKNIGNIYYTAPMVGDHDCVTIQIDYYNEGVLNIYTLDEITWDGIIAHVDRLLDNEWNKFRKLKTEVPDNVKWFNAVSAVITLSSEADAELFGGFVKDADGAITTRVSLRDSWGINAKQDLLDRLDSLYAGRSAEQANKIVEELRAAGIDPNSLSEGDYYEFEWRQSKNAIAWDMVRMIRIASLGYLADFLSYDEAIGYCTAAGKKLQSLFHSWDDMFANYMQGYVYWSGEDPEDEESKSYQRIQIYSWLKSLQRSPYHIDWYTKL